MKEMHLFVREFDFSVLSRPARKTGANAAAFANLSGAFA